MGAVSLMKQLIMEKEIKAEMIGVAHKDLSKKAKENNEIIQKLFNSESKGVSRLKIIKYTGLGYTAKEIAERLFSDAGYIQNERGQIKSLIIENFEEFSKYSNKRPADAIKDFYFQYKDIFKEIEMK